MRMMPRMWIGHRVGGSAHAQVASTRGKRLPSPSHSRAQPNQARPATRDLLAVSSRRRWKGEARVGGERVPAADGVTPAAGPPRGRRTAPAGPNWLHSPQPPAPREGLCSHAGYASRGGSGAETPAQALQPLNPSPTPPGRRGAPGSSLAEDPWAPPRDLLPQGGDTRLPGPSRTWAAPGFTHPAARGCPTYPDTQRPRVSLAAPVLCAFLPAPVPATPPPCYAQARSHLPAHWRREAPPYRSPSGRAAREIHV